MRVVCRLKRHPYVQPPSLNISPLSRFGLYSIPTQKPYAIDDPPGTCYGWIHTKLGQHMRYIYAEINRLYSVWIVILQAISLNSLHIISHSH